MSQAVPSHGPALVVALYPGCWAFSCLWGKKMWSGRVTAAPLLSLGLLISQPETAAAPAPRPC